jgi:hypothetical protein
MSSEGQQVGKTLIDLLLNARSCLRKFILLTTEFISLASKLCFPRNELLLKLASLSL